MSFSIYVHVPFCVSRCPYCAFYSGEPLDLLPRYNRWIQGEIGTATGGVRSLDGPVNTVYFGGGTPSLLAPAAVASILAAVDARWGLSAEAEVTLETNPADELDRAGLRTAGINRLSIGVQSLNDSVLEMLGRRHRADSALRAVVASVRESFRTTADLIFGLPGFEPSVFRAWATQLRELGVEHVSTYSLEVHPETPFASRQAAGTLTLPSPPEEEAQWEALHDALESQGFQPYEVSNYARPGAECRHNLAYWEGGAYLGLGPGAHGFSPSLGPWGTRFWNEPGLAAYAAAIDAGRPPPGQADPLDNAASLLEFLFLGLRRPAPIDFGNLAARHGAAGGRVRSALAGAVEEGLLLRYEHKPDCFRPTLAGMRKADGLAVWLSHAFESRS